MTAVERPTPPVRTHKQDRKWVGKSIRRVEDPQVPAAAAAATSTTSRCPACCTRPCCAARMPHARIIVDRHQRPPRRLPGRARRHHRRTTRPSSPTRSPTSAPTPPRTRGAAWRWTRSATSAKASRSSSPTSRYLAEDALALIDVEYEPLPAVVDPDRRAWPRTPPLVHDDLGSNVAYERTFDFGDVDGDFAGADVVVTDQLRWPRSGGQPLETVGAVADFDRGHRQRPHPHQLAELHQLPVHGRGHAEGRRPTSSTSCRCPPAAASARKLFATKSRVIAAHVLAGGRAPGQVHRGPRRQHSNCDHHGSDRIYDVRARADARRHHHRPSTSTPSTTTAPTSSSASATTATRWRRSSAPTRSAACGTAVAAVLTNKSQQGAYRGFGSEVNNWMLEQMVDARRARAGPRPGRDPAAQLHPPESSRTSSRPATSTTPATTTAVLDKALELARLRALARRSRREAREEGRYIGIGLDHRPGAHRVLARPSSGSGSTSPARP